MGCMGLVSEKMPGGVWGSSLDILDLRWVAVPRLEFGMMCGVGIRHLMQLFRSDFGMMFFNTACFKDASVADHLQISSDS